MGLTKIYSGCRKCPYLPACDHKRLEEHGFLEPAAAEAAQPVVQPMIQAHDYRTVKIAETTTVTIDLEDMKKKLTENHFPPLLFREGAL